MADALTPDQQRFADALLAPDLPAHYANGFLNGFSAADVTIILQLNDRPVARVTLAFPVVKSLAQKLAAILSEIELRTGLGIPTVEEVQQLRQQGAE